MIITFGIIIWRSLWQHCFNPVILIRFSTLAVTLILLLLVVPLLSKLGVAIVNY